MKLSEKTSQYIQDLLTIAKLVNIDNLIIEQGLIRGVDDLKTVVMHQHENIPSLEFEAIGINRISLLQSRLAIAKNQQNFVMEAKVREGDHFVSSLLMKGKGVKIDYRCANPNKLIITKGINDAHTVRVKLNPESVKLLQQGHAAMGSEYVTILNNNDGVSFELTDTNNDAFKHAFTSEVTSLTDNADNTFAFRYPIKTILALFKHSPDASFDIGKHGTLKFPINDTNIIVIPGA